MNDKVLSFSKSASDPTFAIYVNGVISGRTENIEDLAKLIDLTDTRRALLDKITSIESSLRPERVATRKALAVIKETYGKFAATVGVAEQIQKLKQMQVIVGRMDELGATAWGRVAKGRLQNRLLPPLLYNFDSSCFLACAVQVLFRLPAHEDYLRAMPDGPVKAALMNIDRAKQSDTHMIYLNELRAALGEEVSYCNGGFTRQTWERMFNEIPELSMDAQTFPVLREDALLPNAFSAENHFTIRHDTKELHELIEAERKQLLGADFFYPRILFVFLRYAEYCEWIAPNKLKINEGSTVKEYNLIATQQYRAPTETSKVGHVYTNLLSEDESAWLELDNHYWKVLPNDQVTNNQTRLAVYLVA